MKKPLILISIALLGIGSGPACCQENGMIPKEEKIVVPPFATASPEQEVEIRRLIEDFVITEKENQARAAEQDRYEKAEAHATKEAQKEAGSDPDPFSGTIMPRSLYETPPEALKELRGYAKVRTDAFKRLIAFNELAFPILASHLDDERPSRMHWNHTFARTVGALCYRVIHDQLTEFPEDYSQYGLRRTGRDGKGHQKPYWGSAPYDESGGLGKWLEQNQNLSYPEKRIKCLNWLLDGEKKIGVIDPEGYYENILPLELAILELKASTGQDVANDLARVRKLAKMRPANQVPKELLPDGPLPEIEAKHALQETSATLKSCPDGHTTLRDIPILYGSFPIQTKDPADWNDEDKALAARRDAKEVILGGELDSAEDPRFQTCCLSCGYRYEMLAVPDLGANWIKNGQRFADFTIVFSEAARSLPFAEMAGTDFSVAVSKERVVASETIEITVPANKKDEFVAKIEKWIDENHFKRSLLHIETPPFPRLDEQPVEDDKARFYVDVHTDSGKGTTRFGFYLERSGY
ncbi:MAG: hypothetical protein V4819_15710 [Verrucomicrobiota bacterium]